MSRAGYSFTWNGNDIGDGINRAIVRTLAGTAERTASEAKQVVHRVSGTLSRSIHTAKPGYDDGDGDLGAAQGSKSPLGSRTRVPNAMGNMNYVEHSGGADLQNSGSGAADDIQETEPGLFEVWVGSWIVYAFIEEVVRGHAYMQPALEAAMADFPFLLGQAIAEEMGQ